ncbi:MAG: hypothetical protein K2Q22_00370, partial [Cytophagales bacterium]|nr:hypothetical protein [Cytophagales bacterium]
MITFKSTVSITGSATLNVNGSGAKPIKKQVTVDLTAGDILNGQFVTVIYDGTNFQLLSSVFSSNGTSWLVGGNTITGSNLLGTLNNSDLTLVSNSVPGIRISATSSTPGYVGIGTLTPTMPLHVSSKVPYFLGQSFFNGSAMFENTYLSNSSSIGIGMYTKSNANEYGVGAVIDGGQLGLYAISQVTGSGLGTRIGIQTRASGGLSGIGVDANSFGTNSSIGARMVGNSTVGDAKGIDVRGDTQDGRAYGVAATATSGTNLAYGGDFSASSTNSDSYGGNFSSNSANGASYGVKISSNSTIGATVGLDISSQTNSTGVAYGENINSYSRDNDAYGSYITSTSNNGSYSYGQYIYNTNYNTAGIAFGSYLYNTGSGASTGLQITNYAGTGYSSVGIYASAFGGSANYSGYFASGDVFVNDRIGVGTSNPSERITVENANYGITHRDGTGIGSAIMSTYIGNFYTTSFIPGASIGTQTDHPFFIYINNNGDKFYVGNSTQNYNVGVGTNDP